MTRNEKIVLGLAALFAFGGSSSKKKKKASPKSQNAPSPLPQSKESPPLPGRPESTKDEPGETPSSVTPDEGEGDDTQVVRERLKLEQEQAKKGKGGTPPSPRKPVAKQKPKPKPRTREQQKKVNDQALRLAEQMHDFYIDRGELPEVAAADAMTLYLLAGGTDLGQIKGYQKLIGVEPTGGYDAPTRDRIIELLDPAVDRATSIYMILIHAGEDPRYAAAEALATYVLEQKKDPDHIPLVAERLAALQQQFMSTPTGEYDEATKLALVQFGVVPP